MKRFLIGLGIIIAAGGGGLAIMAAQYVPHTPKGSKVGDIPVGDMSREQVAYKLRQWWDSARKEPLTLKLNGSGETYETTASRAGIALDPGATVAKVEFDSFFTSLKRSLTSDVTASRTDLVFKTEKVDLRDLREFVASRVPERRPARVTFRDGAFDREPEVAGFKLDESKVATAALQAYRNQETGSIPVIEDSKKVPDDALASITEVMSEFTTRFSEGKATRASNIRTAVSKINGLVLAPGEQFSFNKTVGKRTVESGFKVAGVYKNGKHDVDLGGGICQVSTTLYNAALFANLKIPRRQNHSMPVPYVPLGRDATVDYGSADLVLENNTEQPIAISASVVPGSITFRVLGKKDTSLSVKIVSGPSRSWDAGETQQRDPSLPAGYTKVIEKGTMGRAISTFRVVYRDGVEVARQPLGQSYYRGGKRIVVVGTAAAAPPEDPAPPEPPGEPTLAGG